MVRLSSNKSTRNVDRISVEQDSLPRNAISNFSSSLARHGKYGSRPKVEIPEKTESAYNPISVWSIARLPPDFIGQSVLEFHRPQVVYYTISSCEALQSVLGYGLHG